MQKSLRLAAVVVGLLLVRIPAARASITSATFDPPHPTVQDQVTITLTGELPGCSQIVSTVVTPPPDFLSTGTIRIGYFVCPVNPTPPLQPFGQAVVVGPLPAGFYTVETEDGLFAAQLAVSTFPTFPIESLFLSFQRFEVTVAWHTANASGIGHPKPISDDSGYFWFFDPKSAEVMVKIVDGTAVNGHFWVFLGGLSDVDYTVTITDRFHPTQPVVRTYTNPRGTVGSQVDTKAFVSAI